MPLGERYTHPSSVGANIVGAARSVALHWRNCPSQQHDRNSQDMPSQTSLLLHISKPAAAICLGHHYTAHKSIADHGPPLPTASRRLRGRDANLCRSRRHVMCRIRRRSTPDSSEYPKYALLSDCYRYIRRRGSGMPPSEALNRADEWSFSLCCVAIFSLGGLRDVRSSLRDEPAVPFCVIE